MPIESTGDSRLARLVGARQGQIFELILIVTLAISLALAVQSWAVKPYLVPSESMKPTLDIGQRVLVNRFSTRLGGDPEIGDVVVFHPPLNAVPEEQAAGETLADCGVEAPRQERGQACPAPGQDPADATFIKRVVAGPGDQLKIVDGIPIVNEEAVKGNWEIVPCRGAEVCDYRTEITIPADHFFMMGDNRPASKDSRFWGPVPRDWIIGQGFATYWPPDRIGAL